MLKALDYKIKYRQLVDELGGILNGSEYAIRYSEFAKQFQNISDREKICIVVAGDWSTGKSTLIKALTDDESIGIDTDIKTDRPHIYEYNGVCIVDTPGLNSGNDEHTRLAENEINYADRVIYCITAQQMFSQTNIKEFVAIVNRFGSENKVILAVTKFGLEATGDEDPFDTMNRIYDSIDSNLKENGIMDDQYNSCIFSAQRYIEGMRSQNDDMVEASYFKGFMDLIEESDNNMEFLTCKKCRHQGELIDKFISEIMEETSSKYSMEKKNDQIRIDKRKEIQKRIEGTKREVIRILKRKMLETERIFNDMLNADKDIDENEIKDEIERLVEYCLTEVSTYIDNSLSQIDEVTFDILNINTDVSFTTKTNKKKQSSGLFKIFHNTEIFSKAGDKLGSGIEKISELAKPVIVQEKRHLFKKSEIIMSEMGGSGTALHSILTKRFPKNGAQLSMKLGKLSTKVGKYAGIIVIEGMAVAISIGGSVKEQHDEKKKLQRRGIFRNDLHNEISEIEKLIKREIEDQFEEISKRVDEEYIDTDSVNGKLLSILQKKKIELKKLTDDFNEVGNNE